MIDFEYHTTNTNFRDVNLRKQKNINIKVYFWIGQFWDFFLLQPPIIFTFFTPYNVHTDKLL